MLKSRLLRLLCAAALVVGLAGPTVPLHAAPLELPSVTSIIDWLLGGWDAESPAPMAATGASEAYPTADPNGQPTQVSPTDSAQTTESLPEDGGEGEAHPTADPNG